jgi:hypothetical protein
MLECWFLVLYTTTMFSTVEELLMAFLGQSVHFRISRGDSRSGVSTHIPPPYRPMENVSRSPLVLGDYHPF